MSSEWEIKRLGDLFKLKSGSTPSKRNKEYWGGDIPWISASSMYDYFVSDSENKITNKALKDSGRFVEKGIVLLLVRGSILHQRIPVCLTQRKVAFNQDVKALIPKADISSEFIFYWLRGNEKNLLQMVDNTGIGAGKIDTDQINKLEINLPPKSYRNKIIEHGQNLDQKIHLNQQTNETLEAMAQAIFKSWFVDFDPVRAKIEAKSAGRDPNRATMAAITGISLEQDWDQIETALDQKLARMSEAQQQQLTRTAELFPDELVESEIGEMPKGWSVKSLDEIADYLNGRAMQKYPPEDGKRTLPVLKIAQLRKGDTEGADTATADIPERFKVRNGDMIFSWSGSLIIRLWAGGDAALNQHLFKVTSEDYDQWFYYHWTKHHLDNFIRIAESKAVTMGHIKRSHLKEAKCAIPDQDLLEIGGQQIMPLLQKSVRLNLESKQLSELRDTLLPKLISGKVGV